MKARTLWQSLRSGQLPVLARVAVLQRPFYRMAYLGAAGRDGLLARLAREPASLDQLAEELAGGPAGRGGLEAWLECGVRLGVLRLREGRYALRGRFVRHLAQPDHDAALAFVEEASGLHYKLINDSLARLRAGRPFTLADQDGELIARSSRTVEALVFETVDDAIAADRPLRLLEIGCGSATYLRHAAARNPRLTALGLELQPEVAEMARENLRRWGFADRVEIEVGDVRERPPDPSFDVATLHNNIYYFPTDGRVALLAHVRHFLRPGGVLLVTTGCRGGSASMAILNLWAVMTAGCGALPEPEEMERQMKQAGYGEVRIRSLLPGDRYYAFTGRQPAASA